MKSYRQLEIVYLMSGRKLMPYGLMARIISVPGSEMRDDRRHGEFMQCGIISEGLFSTLEETGHD